MFRADERRNDTCDHTQTEADEDHGEGVVPSEVCEVLNTRFVGDKDVYGDRYDPSDERADEKAKRSYGACPSALLRCRGP